MTVDCVSEGRDKKGGWKQEQSNSQTRYAKLFTSELLSTAGAGAAVRGQYAQCVLCDLHTGWYMEITKGFKGDSAPLLGSG